VFLLLIIDSRGQQGVNAFDVESFPLTPYSLSLSINPFLFLFILPLFFRGLLSFAPFHLSLVDVPGPVSLILSFLWVLSKVRYRKTYDVVFFYGPFCVYRKQDNGRDNDVMGDDTLAPTAHNRQECVLPDTRRKQTKLYLQLPPSPSCWGVRSADSKQKRFFCGSGRRCRYWCRPRRCSFLLL
jgi:hypothetical protein